MTKPTNFERIHNFLSLADASALSVGCERLLVFLVIRQNEGLETSATDLFQTLEFGTWATVHRKLSKLKNFGLISVAQSEADNRSKSIHVNSKGISYLTVKANKLHLLINA